MERKMVTLKVDSWAHLGPLSRLPGGVVDREALEVQENN
jgi:hypothetical protein